MCSSQQDLIKFILGYLMNYLKPSQNIENDQQITFANRAFCLKKILILKTLTNSKNCVVDCSNTGQPAGGSINLETVQKCLNIIQFANRYIARIFHDPGGPNNWKTLCRWSTEMPISKKCIIERCINSTKYFGTLCSQEHIISIFKFIIIVSKVFVVLY